MIIDATRKPVFVLPDEVKDSVILRSAGKTETSGHLGYWHEIRGTKRELIDIQPEMSLRQGSVVTHETRIPLPGSNRFRTTTVPRNLALLARGRPPPTEESERPLPLAMEPMEVVSCYTDPLTNFSGTWRLGIRVQLHQNKKFWLVELFDGTSMAPLTTVVVRGLDPNPERPEQVPLRKHLRDKSIKGNAWTKILDEEEEGD